MSRGQSQFWADGNRKWQDQRQKIPVPTPAPIDYGNVLTENLIGCDIKTDVINISMKVERNGTIMKLFEIRDIVTWSIENNVITLFMRGSEKFRLVFMSMAQAVKADFRMYLITNGEDIQGCNDDAQFVCGRTLNLSLTFS